MKILEPTDEFTIASQVSRIRSQAREPFEQTLRSLPSKERRAVKNQIRLLNKWSDQPFDCKQPRLKTG